MGYEPQWTAVRWSVSCASSRYLNPYAVKTSGHMGNLLFMSLFLTLLVGANNILIDSDAIGDDASTFSEAAGVVVMLAAVICIILAVAVLVYDAVVTMRDERTAYRRRMHGGPVQKVP